MPTLRDVAKAAGVSVTTASYVLNNKGAISETTREKVLEAIVALGYKRRSPAQNHVALIGVVPQTLASWLTHACAEYGLELSEIRIGRDDPIDPNALKRFDGAIMYGGLWSPHCFDVIAQHIPTVFLGGSHSGHQSDRVWIDNAGAVYVAMRYLIDAGHRHIGLVNGPKDTITTGEKQLGFERALRDFPGVEGHSVNADDFRETAGLESFQTLKSTFPTVTAVVSAEVEMTLGILSYCRTHDIEVGTDLSVIAMRDHDDFESLQPGISAFSIPNADIARAAVEQLITRINAPHLLGRRLLLLPNLVARHSVGHRVSPNLNGQQTL